MKCEQWNLVRNLTFLMMTDHDKGVLNIVLLFCVWQEKIHRFGKTYILCIDGWNYLSRLKYWGKETLLFSSSSQPVINHRNCRWWQPLFWILFAGVVPHHLHPEWHRKHESVKRNPAVVTLGFFSLTAKLKVKLSAGIFGTTVVCLFSIYSYHSNSRLLISCKQKG